jgi:two-component system sensor histidine kinase AtoS
MIAKPFQRLTGRAQEIRLSTNDFRILLDQLEKPALIASFSRWSILACNLSFTEFSGFGTDEIFSAGIEKLVPDIETEKIVDGARQEWTILRKNRPPVRASVAVTFIQQGEKLALLTIENEENKGFMLEPVQASLIDAQITNLESLFDAGMTELVHEIVATSMRIMQARYAAFYLQEGRESEPVKISTDENLFPAKIPAIEARRLEQIDVWEPGKRVLSEIHRTGRMNNLGAIITLPVKITETKNGWLVLVLNDLKQKDAKEPLLEPITAWASALLQNQQVYLELKASNNRFFEENKQYGQFFENAGDSALILDEHDFIQDCNKNACDFLKYSRVELIGQKAEVIFENSEIERKLQEKRIHEKRHQDAPAAIFDREGSQKPVAYKFVSLDEEGRKLLILTDLSVQTEALKRLQAVENKAALGEVIADFAHEVRNPMNSFVSGLQVIKKKVASDDFIANTVAQMQDDCVRINDLMESVLSYSRQKVENFKEVDLILLLRRIINQNSSKFRQSNIEALFQSKVPTAVISADQRSLEQAFINLVNNAYDAIKQDGGVISVQIDTRGEADEFLVVSISDTGPGIPPEIREKLFEPFVSSKPKGTGLGLAITKRMIEAHQGTIELETFPGGTIFRVILHNTAIQGERA